MVDRGQRREAGVARETSDKGNQSMAEQPRKRRLPGIPSRGCLIFGLVCLAAFGIVSWSAYDDSMERAIRDRCGDVYSDMRTLATALYGYAVDNGPQPPPLETHGPYPPFGTGAGGINASAEPNDPSRRISTFAVRPGGGTHLTTPIAYIVEIQRDRFSRGGKAYYGYYTTGAWYILQSMGPDGVYDLTDLSQLPTEPDGPPDLGRMRLLVYDPSNGTWSRGDILTVNGRPLY